MNGENNVEYENELEKEFQDIDHCLQQVQADLSRCFERLSGNYHENREELSNVGIYATLPKHRRNHTRTNTRLRNSQTEDYTKSTIAEEQWSPADSSLLGIDLFPDIARFIQGVHAQNALLQRSNTVPRQRRTAYDQAGGNLNRKAQRTTFSPGDLCVTAIDPKVSQRAFNVVLGTCGLRARYQRLRRKGLPLYEQGRIIEECDTVDYEDIPEVKRPKISRNGKSDLHSTKGHHHLIPSQFRINHMSCAAQHLDVNVATRYFGNTMPLKSPIVEEPSSSEMDSESDGTRDGQSMMVEEIYKNDKNKDKATGNVMDELMILNRKSSDSITDGPVLIENVDRFDAHQTQIQSGEYKVASHVGIAEENKQSQLQYQHYPPSELPEKHESKLKSLAYKRQSSGSGSLKSNLSDRCQLDCTLKAEKSTVIKTSSGTQTEKSFLTAKAAARKKKSLSQRPDVVPSPELGNVDHVSDESSSSAPHSPVILNQTSDSPCHVGSVDSAYVYCQPVKSDASQTREIQTNTGIDERKRMSKGNGAKKSDISGQVDSKTSDFVKRKRNKSSITVEVDVHMACEGEGTPNTTVESIHWPEPPKNLPPRERKVSIRPRMPVISEDGAHVGEEVNISEQYCEKRSSLGSHSSPRSPASPLSHTFEYGPVSQDTYAAIEPPSPSSSTSSNDNTLERSKSLLDSMHRKYYPSQYKHQGRASSAEEVSCLKNGEALSSELSKSGDIEKSMNSRGDDLFSRFHCGTYEGSQTLPLPSDKSKHDAATQRRTQSDQNVQHSYSKQHQRKSDSSADHQSISSEAQDLEASEEPESLAFDDPVKMEYPAKLRLRSKSERKPRRPKLIPRSEESAVKKRWLLKVAGEFPNPAQTEKDSVQLRFTESEAADSCNWLRAAGFPQYAQMYEDHQFPIDITSVEKDHDFLDQDSMQSLFRRLNTLNKCATMKIETPLGKLGDESDEEDQCALSDKWEFQRSIRRWSRKDLDLAHPQIHADDILDKSGMRSCSSHDSVITENDDSLSQHGDSPLMSARTPHSNSVPPMPEHPHLVPSSSSRFPQEAPPVLMSSQPHSGGTTPDPKDAWDFSFTPKLRRAASERFRGAKNFLKRMESMKGKKSVKRTHTPPEKLEIGSPVITDTVKMQETMAKLGCKEISPSAETAPDFSDTGKQNGYPCTDHSDPIYDEVGSLDPHVKLNGTDSSGISPSCESSKSVATKSEPAPHYQGHRKTHSSSELFDIISVDPNYKPGTFPKFLNTGYIDMGDGSQINMRTGSFNYGHPKNSPWMAHHRKASSPDCLTSEGYSPSNSQEHLLSEDIPERSRMAENRYSFYDNVPDAVPSPSPSNPQEELDLILSNLMQNIQDLGDALSEPSNREGDSKKSNLEQVSGKFGMTRTEVQSKETNDSNYDHNHGNNNSGHHHQHSENENILALQHSHLHPAEEPMDHSQVLSDDQDDNVSLSGSLSNQDCSDGDTQESRGEESPDAFGSPVPRERRDSGVGSSLTRAPSDRRRHRIRWHSFVKSHRPSLSSQSLQLWNMSAGQLMVLRKLSLLKVTALMERYCPPNRSGWNWIVPKLMRKLKSPDYKDKNVFGIPLLVILQRTGQPLPQCMLYAMRCLRRSARDALGIFRKSGVRSRIQKLRNQIEADPEGMDFDSLQAYDVADLVKLYFRELPECLLTNKLSDTFIAIFTHVPSEQRLEALQAAIMLLPDENRQVLHSLLLFLGDMAQHASQNQMNASNLAVCFAPSLFHICGSRVPPQSSPKWSRKAAGVPDQRELMEQKSAHQCLTMMISECKKLFTVSEDMIGKCRLSYLEQGDPVPIEDLAKRGSQGNLRDYSAHIDSWIQGLLKEARDKFKGWVSVSNPSGVDVAYKKVGDGHPLRLWKCALDVEAPPVEVLNRVLRERHVWDDDLLKWRVVDRVGNDTEVFQYILNSMAPHPTRDFVELRSWRTDLNKGACVLVSTSVEHPETLLLGGVRGVTLASRYLIEPCGAGKSRLTLICRVDYRGNTPEWYNKAYGHICANYIIRIRDSFVKGIVETDGPETKV